MFVRSFIDEIMECVFRSHARYAYQINGHLAGRKYIVVLALRN